MEVDRYKKEYKVMSGAVVEKLPALIMQYEKEGWVLQEVISQPVTVQNELIKGINDQPTTNFTVFYPLMYRLWEDTHE